MNSTLSNSRLVSILIRYGTAALLVGLALVLTLFLWTFVTSFASPLFLLAIIIVAWKEGVRAGIFATLLSGLAIDYFFITPEYQLSGHLDDILRVLIFTLEGAAFCWLINWRTLAAEEIRQSREHLQALSLRQQKLLEDERKRIALEIHDELGQFLTALKMEIHLLNKQFSAAQRQSECPVNNAEIAKKVEEVLQLIDTTIATVRRIATELRPAILDDLGLVAAIEWQAREFQRRTGISCALSSNIENISLNSEFSTAVFRIFQETLTNVTRHAEAKKVKVQLEKSQQNLILRVEDNGKGIETENADGKRSLGILGMRERARLIGGELKVSKRGGGGGTIVELTAPLVS